MVLDPLATPTPCFVVTLGSFSRGSPTWSEGSSPGAAEFAESIAGEPVSGR